LKQDFVPSQHFSSLTSSSTSKSLPFWRGKLSIWTMKLAST
jgi:hypothetical protein